MIACHCKEWSYIEGADMRFKCYNSQETWILLCSDTSFLFSPFLSFDWGFVNCKEKNLGKAMSWKLKRVKKCLAEVDYLPHNSHGPGISGKEAETLGFYESKKLSSLVNQETQGGWLLLWIVVIIISELLTSTTFRQQVICGKLRSYAMQRQRRTLLKKIENPIWY